jgi:PII-like signaling protein
VNDDCLKLTTYFGERDRAGGGFLADALMETYARHELQASLILRGIQGFGVHHHLQTDRLLTLSEDLPMVSVAVDARERIAAVLPAVERVSTRGLITLERARLLTGHLEPAAVAERAGEQTKLTVYVGRGERAAGRPARTAVVEVLHRHGVAGATVLLGVDGTAHGHRRRARFAGTNAHVPLMIVSVGEGAAIAAALAELEEMLTRPLATLERVVVCKRDGRRLAEPDRLPESDPAGLGVWQKLMVYCGEQSRHRGRPLYGELIRRLRAAGAMGATALRGIYGYHGDHEPHGDSFRQLRRRVPVVCVVVDRPERTRRWFEIVDELTGEAGLVTSETVPAFRAGTHGGLELSARSG